MNLPEQDYFVALKVMGGAHNVLCLLVVISYFVCNHPRLPDPRDFVAMCKSVSGGGTVGFVCVGTAGFVCAGTVGFVCVCRDS